MEAGSSHIQASREPNGFLETPIEQFRSRPISQSGALLALLPTATFIIRSALEIESFQTVDPLCRVLTDRCNDRTW